MARVVGGGSAGRSPKKPKPAKMSRQARDQVNFYVGLLTGRPVQSSIPTTSRRRRRAK